jgi:hypothetical protein
MKSYEKYYTRSLYPLQNGIIGQINSLNTPFYLTGGTALSRAYFNHRYSDDLDFFVNGDSHFLTYISSILKILEEHCSLNKLTLQKDKAIVTDAFAQIYIEKAETMLKIEFVNDIAAHFGEISIYPELGKVDSPRNILSIKITALFRYEPKDIVDIWIIAKNYHFNWETVYSEAREKELGIDPLVAAEIIKTFPEGKLDYIKWIKKYPITDIKNDIDVIALDMINAGKNSLSLHNNPLK